MARTGKLIGAILHPAGRGPFIGPRRRPLSLRERGWGEGQRSPCLQASHVVAPSALWPCGIDRLAQAWRRWPRGRHLTSHSAVEKHLFACAKKGTKETRPRRHALRFAPGPRAGREFSYGTSLCHTKTPSSMTAPFGFYPARSPCLMGAPKSRSNSNSRSRTRLLLLPGPLRSGSPGG